MENFIIIWYIIDILKCSEKSKKDLRLDHQQQQQKNCLFEFNFLILVKWVECTQPYIN